MSRLNKINYRGNAKTIMDIASIEAKYTILKEDFENGIINAEAFQSEVDGLRIQDEQGRYWMIGAESGAWYYYDGATWIQADPGQAGSLPFVDENGTHWMLDEYTNSWLYYDGDNWVNPDSNGTQLAYDNALVDETQYYQDAEGRYWTIGKKSGEWYYYDETGWHKADGGPPTPALDSFGATEGAADYADTQQPLPPNATRPLDPAYPAHQQPVGPTQAQPVQPQPDYQPAQAGMPTIGQPSVDPYGYTAQPYPTQSQPVANPYAYAQPPAPQTQSPGVPSTPVPVGETEPGVWMYFDGEQWLKYKEEENPYPAVEEEYFDDEESYDEPLIAEDEPVIDIEDTDEFVEVVEVAEEDILDFETDSSTVDAEFQVEVFKPGESTIQPTAAAPQPAPEPTPQPQPTISQTSQTTTPDSQVTAPVSTPIEAPVEPQAVAQTAPQPQPQPKPRSQPQQTRPDFNPRIMPAWFWTSLASVVGLFVVAGLLIGILYIIDNRQNITAIPQVVRNTPTLQVNASAATPTIAPPPSATVPAPPAPTPIPLAQHNSSRLGFSIDYPSGWVLNEDNDRVIFSPSTRSLNNETLNGAAMWVSYQQDDIDSTSLLAGELARFEPIQKTLNQGTMDIGGQEWLSTQIQFESADIGEDAIALVASTIRDDAGYTLVAVAPATEWEDYISLFQYPVNSFSFEAPQAVAEADSTSDNPGNGDNAAQNNNDDGGDPTGSSQPAAQPTSTPRPTATGTATLTPTPLPTVIVYEIVSGDTLGGIAVRYDVSIEDLIAINNLGSRDTILSLGQELLIPQEGADIVALITEAEDEAAEEAPETISDLEDEEPDEEEISTLTTALSDDDEDTSTGPSATRTRSAGPTATPRSAAVAAAPTPQAPPTATPVPPPSLSGRIIYPAYDAGSRTFRVVSASVDGADQVVLATDASQPYFAQNGILAYRSWEPSQRGIYYINFSSGRQELLSNFLEDGLPSVSPDGTIAFSSRREADRVPRLYRVDEFKNEINLNFNAEYVDHLSDGHLVAKGCTPTGDCGLWILLPNGGGETKISGETSDTAPAANPQSGRIAVMSFNRAGAGNWEIWSLNRDGSDARRLTENGAIDGLPTWSPDGRSIAFVSNRDGTWSVWVMNANGSNQRKLFVMQGPPDGIVGSDEPNSRGWLEERISWIP